MDKKKVAPKLPRVQKKTAQQIPVTEMDERRMFVRWEKLKPDSYNLIIHTDWETDITSAEEWALIDAKAKELGLSQLSVCVETRRDFAKQLQ